MVSYQLARLVAIHRVQVEIFNLSRDFTKPCDESHLTFRYHAFFE